MKILCLQFARFGDIYMSWPVFKALKREHPQAQIHGLFKERFVEAARICGVLDRIQTIPSEQIFRSLLVENDTDKALNDVDTFIQKLKSENYDLIINLSYSPLSSYIASALRSENTVVRGYQRHSDGYLNLNDDISRYFYAQVGTHQANRIHVTDLMAMTAQVTLQDSDSKFGRTLTLKETLKQFNLENKDYIVFHLGASEDHKKLDADFWRALILQFKIYCPEFHLVLVGGQDDKLAAEMINKSIHADRIHNLAGLTNWSQLRDILSSSRLFIGADSGPLHLASLVQTEVLNLSVGQVNFWETGPRTSAGHILRYNTLKDIDLNEVIQAARARLLGQMPNQGYKTISGVPCFESVAGEKPSFEWQLIQAVYMSANFPSTDKIDFVKSIQDLSELNRLAIEAIRKFKDTKIDFLGPYLDRIYESMNLVSKAGPGVAVLVNWLRAEKCRVPPSSPVDLCQSYLEIHLGLKNILQPYILPLDLQEGTTTHG